MSKHLLTGTVTRAFVPWEDVEFETMVVDGAVRVTAQIIVLNSNPQQIWTAWDSRGNLHDHEGVRRFDLGASYITWTHNGVGPSGATPPSYAVLDQVLLLSIDGEGEFVRSGYFEPYGHYYEVWRSLVGDQESKLFRCSS